MTFDPDSAVPETPFDPASAAPEDAPPVRAVLHTAVKVNPDQAARARVLGKTYDAPAEMVLRNLQDVEFQAAVDKADAKLKTSPKLLTSMRTRPEIAPLAHDDIEPLSQIEIDVAKYGAVKAWNGPEPTIKNILSGLAQSFPQGAKAAKAGLDAQMTDFLEWTGLVTLDPVIKADRARKLAQATGASSFTTPDFESTTGGAIYGGVASTIRMLPGMAATLATRSPAPMLAAAGVQTEAEAYGKYKGRGASGAAAFSAAMGEGAVEVATEMLPTKFLADSLGKTGMGEFLVGLLAREIPGEQVATLLQDAIDTAVANPDKTWGEYLAERPEAAYTTLVSTLTQTALMSGVNGAVRRLADNADRVAVAEEDAQNLADLLKTAGSSALRERSPEQFRALMGDMSEGKIYIDGEVLNQLSPEVIATLPQAVQDQIAEAVAANSTVEIPVADVLTIAPGTPLEQLIIENARSEPGALSQADAKAAAGAAQELLQQESERVIAEAADQDAFRASSDAVKSSILEELNTTGRFRAKVNEGMATWATAFYTTMAARTGMTPEQFYAQHKLRILGEPSAVAAGPVMDQPKLGEISVEGYHYSREDRPVITTGAFGTGLQGDKRDEYLNAADKRRAKRAYFYVDKGTGINPESGVGGRGHRATLTNVYDADTDPLRLGGGSQADLETKVLDAGFSGYLSRMGGTQSGNVIMLGDQTIQPEVLGPLGKTSGKVVPAKGQRASLGRDVVVDALQANTALPSGSPTLARWQELLARTPEVADALRAAGVFDGNQGENVYKSDLVKRFQAATEAPVYQQSDAKVNNLTSVAERGERVLGTRATFSPAEKAAVKDSAEKIGVSEKEIAATVRGHKLAHPQAQGWAPLTFVRAEVDEGKVTYVYRPVPYGFSSDADGKQIDTESPAYAKRVKAVAKAMADEVRRVFQRAANGDQNAKNILAQAGWYKAMRARLRQEFGGLGDLFADLLGATSPNTPVRDNWTNAVDTLRRASRGDYDALLPKWVEWADKVDALELDLRGWFNERMAEGLSKKAIKDLPDYKAKLDALKVARKLDDSFLPTKESGKKYGFNGRNVARAMVDLWRVVKNADPDIGRGDTAPKALNFSGNLIGFRTRATIDVWAARMLQRLAGGLRIPSMAETGVSGAMREDGTTTLQFGMGQDIFADAAKRIRADAELKTDPVLAEVNDDDLQAVVWFIEKELWTVNNWTSSAGEGGSFELEASLTGNANQGRIKELRKVIDSSKSKPDAKVAARTELAALERTVDRFVGGLSTQMSLDTQGADYVPTDADMSRLGEEIRLAAYESDNGTQVLASKMLSTEGRYGGVERSLDMEVVARQGYNPTALWAEMLRQAQAAKQDSTFLSRVLRDKEEVDPLRHRPGVEIYFREAAQAAQLEAVLADLAKEGVEFLTVIVDGRRMPGAVAGAMPPAVGVRLQYVPEFDQRYGFDNLLELDDVALAAKIHEKADEMAKLAERVLATVDGVAFAGQFWHDTQVAFSHQYQEKLDGIAAGNAEGTTGEVGSPQWAGEPIRAGLESADRQARETSRGEPDGGTGSPVAGDAAADGTLKQEPQTPRGTFNPRTLELVLNPNANLSTFFHETGHFFLEVMADIASQPNAPAQIVEDFNTFLKWAGVKAGKWNKMTLEQKRPYHERWAESIEQYVMEGKAPSVELAPLMRRFATWLKSVYGSIQKFLGSRPDAEATPLNDDIRRVMDRMLATDEQIQQANEVAGLLPDEIPDAVAAERLNKRSMADLKWSVKARDQVISKMRSEAKIIETSVRQQVAEEVDDMPVYQAKAALDRMTAASPEHKAELAAHKDARKAAEVAAREEVKAALLAENPDVKGLVKGQLLMKNKRDIDNKVDAAMIKWDAANPKPQRVTPDMGPQLESVAAQFGYTSVDEMLQEIAAAEPRSSTIDGMTDQRMLEEHGDLVDERAIQEAANEAVHNEARARSLATELRTQREMLNERTDTGQTNRRGAKITINALVEAAKQFGANIVSRTTILDLRTKAWQHTAAERRAGKAWLAATAAGKTQAAVKAKQDQVLNNAAAKAAIDAFAEVRGLLDYLKKFDKEAARKKLPLEYLDQIDKLLERVDLRVSTTAKQIDRRASLAKWIESQHAIGLDPVLPENLLEDIKLKSFKEMTYEEFVELTESIKNIEHLGRLKSKLLAAKDKREFALIAEEIQASIIANGGKPRPVQLEPDGRIKAFFKGAWAEHRKLNSLVRQMDGGVDNGPFYRALIRSMNDAGASEDVMLEKATEALAKIYAPIEKLKGGVSGDKRFIPEINNSLSRAGRLSVALNWGNPQNRQRVMDGDGWTEAQVNAILATLTPVELKFVNDMWAHIDSYWPEVKAKQMRVSGVVEDKVEAVPFEINGVQMRGGYYPIKYDGDRSIKAEKQEAMEAAAEIMRGAVARPTTRRGHTKARVDEVKGRPVKKDLSVITQHVSQVVHDLAWHEWFVDANRLLNDPRIGGAIRDHHGPEIARAMMDTANAIAVGDVTKQGQIDRLLLLMRSNVTRSIMGASLTTALLQPFGLTQSMARVGIAPVLKGAGRWAGDAMHMESTISWINSKSEFMRLRSKTFNRELREISQRVRGKSKFAQVADASLFYLMQKMQLVADVPTWVGAYEKALAGGVDESAAVAVADEAVLGSQGGGNTKDLSGVQRNLPFLTQFYSYFNATLNLVAEKTALTDFKNPRAAAGWLGDMALLTVIPAILPALITYLLKGGGDDDEPEDIAKKMLEWQASYLFGMFVGLRELPIIWSPFDYHGPPAAKLLNDGKKLVQQAGQGEIDDPAVLATIGFLGTALGIPTTQIIRSYKGWLAWDEGDAPATSILFGPPPRD